MIATFTSDMFFSGSRSSHDLAIQPTIYTHRSLGLKKFEHPAYKNGLNTTNFLIIYIDVQLVGRSAANQGSLSGSEYLNMLTWQLWGALLLVLWLYFLWTRRRFYLLTLKIPGPLGYPIVGMAHKLIRRESVCFTYAC